MWLYHFEKQGLISVTCQKLCRGSGRELLSVIHPSGPKTVAGLRMTFLTCEHYHPSWMLMQWDLLIGS